jgi:hypothetical protein
VGGDFEPVKACESLLEACAPCAKRKVVGMPDGVSAHNGLLLLRTGPSSPLARAGLREGDLVTAVDGQPVRDPLAFRCAVEARPPGSTVTLDAWRDGAMLRAPVTVGRETYERFLSIGLFLPLCPHADLWPFDDGIDVFGLVTAKSNPARHDLDGPRRTYLAKAVPEACPEPPQQESVRVAVIPLCVGTYHRVVAQEPVPAVAMR